MGDFFSFALRRGRFALATAIGIAFVGVGIYADATGEAVLGFQSWAWQAVGAATFFVAVIALLYRWDQEHHAPKDGKAISAQAGKFRWPWPHAKAEPKQEAVPRPTITQTPPLRLSQEESERRIRAVDEMYEVLNLQAAGVISAGQQ